MSATAGPLAVPQAAADPDGVIADAPTGSSAGVADPATPATPEGPTPDEIQEPVLESLDRAITGLITFVPLLLLVLAAWQMWNRELHWRDVAIFLIMYIPTGLGV